MKHITFLVFLISISSPAFASWMSTTVDAFATNIVTKSNTTYNVADSDHTILCDTSSNNVTINLPDINSSSDAGRILIIKKISSSNICYIHPDTTNSDDIDENTSDMVLYSQWDSVTLQSDGSNTWMVLNGTANNTKMFGYAKWPSTTNCAWSTTSTSYGDFSADTDCTDPTGSNLAGNASAPSTKIPGVTFSALPPGEYLVIAELTAYDANADANGCEFRLSDGTTTSTEQAVLSNSVVARFPITLTARFSYSSLQSSTTFQIQGQSDSGSNACQVRNEQGDTVFTVYKLPSTN